MNKSNLCTPHIGKLMKMHAGSAMRARKFVQLPNQNCQHL